MGTVRKIGSEYIIDFFARGLKYQQKAGSSRKHAEDLLKSIEGKIAKGEMQLIVRDVDCDIFFYDFLKFANENYPPKTYQRFHATLQHFERYLTSKFPHVLKLSQMTPQVFESYRVFLLKPDMAKRQGILQNINLKNILLREVFAYAIKLGYLNDNPLLHIPLLKTPLNSKIQTLSENEKALLFEKAFVPLRPAIEILLQTGMDLQELVLLKWKDVDFKKRTLSIVHKKKRLSFVQRREVPLSHHAYQLLKSLSDGKASEAEVFHTEFQQPWTLKAITQNVMEVFKRCDFKGRLTPFSLRHTFIFDLLKKDISLVRIQKLLGYEDIAMLLIYLPLMFSAKSEFFIYEGIKKLDENK